MKGFLLNLRFSKKFHVITTCLNDKISYISTKLSRTVYLQKVTKISENELQNFMATRDFKLKQWVLNFNNKFVTGISIQSVHINKIIDYF